MINLSKQNSILKTFVNQLRDNVVQQDSLRFRRNLERVGEIMAYEISKKMSYAATQVETPLGIADSFELTDKVVVISILRAGLPLHQGFLNYFDQAENGFVSAYRSHHKDGTFDIQTGYITCPDLSGKSVVLVDPMVATGASMSQTIDQLKDYGTWDKLYVATVIASQQGLDHVHRLHANAEIWAADIDEELTAKSYIVPGLGDAGDLAFGSKLQS